MTEQNAKQADPRIIVIDAKTGRAESNRYHLFIDCSFIKDQPPEEIETIGDRETRLLGLKVCSVCERRKTGGPAVSALNDLLEGSGIDAFGLIEDLKQRGFYIAQRGVRS